MLIKIAKDIHLVAGENNGRFPFSHSFLITGNATALIDTGCGHETLTRIKSEYRPDLVINSHSHPDHTNGNGLFLGTEILVPAQHQETSGNVFLLSERLVSHDVAPEWRRFALEDMRYQQAAPTAAYEDGRVFDFGSVKLRAVHAPGHLDDHFCFFEENLGLLLSTDIDLTGFGPWYGNPESDIEVFRGAVRKVMALKPAVVASSHRLPITEGTAGELESFYAKFERNEKTILEMLEQPMTFEEILERKPFYRAYPYRHAVLRFFEGQMILKHLEEMTAGELIKREGDRYLRSVASLL